MGKRYSVAHTFLLGLFKNPVASIKNIQNITGLSAKAAGDLAAVFVEKGILEEITKRQRNRIFVFQEYLKLFSSWWNLSGTETAGIVLLLCNLQHLRRKFSMSDCLVKKSNGSKKYHAKEWILSMAKKMQKTAALEWVKNCKHWHENIFIIKCRYVRYVLDENLSVC